MGRRRAQDGLGVIDEHDVGGYGRNEVWLFANGLAKSEGVAILEGNRDIGDNRTRDDIIPSEEVSSMMGVQIDDVNLRICKGVESVKLRRALMGSRKEGRDIRDRMRT
jgi:hypothetical protein